MSKAKRARFGTFCMPIVLYEALIVCDSTVRSHSAADTNSMDYATCRSYVVARCADQILHQQHGLHSMQIICCGTVCRSALGSWTHRPVVWPVHARTDCARAARRMALVTITGRQRHSSRDDIEWWERESRGAWIIRFDRTRCLIDAAKDGTKIDQEGWGSAWLG